MNRFLWILSFYVRMKSIPDIDKCILGRGHPWFLPVDSSDNRLHTVILQIASIPLRLIREHQFQGFYRNWQIIRILTQIASWIDLIFHRILISGNYIKMYKMNSCTWDFHKPSRLLLWWHQLNWKEATFSDKLRFIFSPHSKI